MEVKILSWDILKLLPQIVPQIPLLGRNQKSYWGKRKDEIAFGGAQWREKCNSISGRKKG